MLLPFDVIDRIFAIVAINDLKTGAQATLASCSRVSHSLHDLTAAHLYRHVHTNYACKTLLKRRDLAALVHSAEFELVDAGWNLPEMFDDDDEFEEVDGPTLTLQPQPRMLRDLGLDDDMVEDIRAGDGRALVTAVLRVLPNLQALKLIIMDPLGRYIDILKPSRSDVAPSLTKVHLRYGSGSDDHDPTPVFDAFALPTIHTLTIAAFRGSSNAEAESTYSKGTSTVKHLTMDSRTYAAKLHTQWLLLPKALTTLTTSMAVTRRHLYELQHSRLTLRSLTLGSFTLHSLILHKHAYINGLTDFLVLEHIEIPINVLLMNGTDVGYMSLSDRLPKSVRSLSLIWGRCITFEGFGTMVLALVASHSLRKFVLREAPRAYDDIDRRVYENIQSACETAGVEWSAEYGY
jgi:hypothetical protein